MSTPHHASADPNPALIMQTLCAFQQTQALKGAIDLDIFTHIADGANTPEEISAKAGASRKVLDISSGHGMFGIDVAKHNPQAHVYALDWKNVLEVARENAARFGVAERFHTIPGSAFDVDMGSGYDLVLLPNFLHHF